MRQLLNKLLFAVTLLATNTLAQSANLQVIEYYHAEFNHYFISGNPDEIAKLDSGGFTGWMRTGHSFEAYPLGQVGTEPMCRFFSTSFAPKSSHFYTPYSSECAIVKTNPDWQFEGEVFDVGLSNPQGICGTGLVPLYRYYNNGQGGAPNHRYATSQFMRQQMVVWGWIPEGNGVGVIGCVPEFKSFGNGTLIVGTDIQPGTYRTRASASGCYFRRLRGFGGTSSETIAIQITDAPAIVTIAATDAGFSSERCAKWTQDPSAITASQMLVPDGTFIVGTDILVGTYRTRVPSSGCYFKRLKGFSATTADTIASAITDAFAVITIAPTDTGFFSEDCGTWTQDLSQVTTSQTSISDGTFIVGTDVLAGTYRTRVASRGCYLKRLKGFSATTADTIASAITDAFAVITIAPTDTGFFSEDCGTWTQDLSQITASQTSFADGTFIVGTDVLAGTYRTRVPSSGCYFKRLKGFSATTADTIASAITDAFAVITIAPTDGGFFSEDCGTWTQDLSQITASQTSFADGTFIVGTDVLEGTYRNSDSSKGCFYKRLRGFSGQSSDTISSGFTQSPAVVTIMATDKGFSSEDCGTWTQV